MQVTEAPRSMSIPLHELLGKAGILALVLLPLAGAIVAGWLEERALTRRLA